MKFLSKEKISNHRYKTPEGYLICLDAIIARTGKQNYTRNELFNDGKDDIVSIDRPAKEVFSSETISSFENKPLVDEHPNEDINVDNHRDYSIGFVRDVRKAVVDDEDVLIANLVITDPEAIAEIESGKKTELSCGYDCDILGDEGNYYQANIRGNHVALCKAGRAGIARIIDSAIYKLRNVINLIHIMGYNSSKIYESCNNIIITIREKSRSLEEDFNRFKKDFKKYAQEVYLKGNDIIFVNPKFELDNYTVNTFSDYIGDKNLGKSFLKIGQKVHLDPSTNKNLTKEDLNSEYEVVGFWYNGKLVTKDPVSKEEFLGMSGVRIKNVYTNENLSVNRFQLMDSIDDIYKDFYTIKDATTTRRIFKESDVGDEDSYLGTTEWSTPKGNMYIYRKNGKIISEMSNDYNLYDLKKGDIKKFNSVTELNNWLNNKMEDSINDIEFKYLSEEAKKLKEELGLYKKQIGSHISTGKKEYFPRENQFKNKTVAELNESINEAIDNLSKGITNPSAWYRLSQHLDAWLGNSELEKIANKANNAIKTFIKYINLKTKDSIEDSKKDLAYNYKNYDVYKIPLNEKGDFKLEVKLNGKTPYKNGLKYGNFNDPQFDLKVKEEIDKDLKKSQFKKEEVEKELNRLGYKVDNWINGDSKFGERNIVNLKPFWSDLKSGITNEELSKFKKDMINLEKYADNLLVSTTRMNGIVVFNIPNFKLSDSINNSDKLIKLTNIIKMISDSKVKDSPITTNVYVEEDIVYDFRDVRSLVKKYNCEVVKKVDKYPGYFRGSGGIYKVLVSGEKKDLNRLVTENYPSVYFDDKKKTL